jgi:hypothetical protein
MNSQEHAFHEFAEFAAKLKDDEKSEAQTFLVHLLEAFSLSASNGETDATLAHRMGEGLGVRASGEVSILSFPTSVLRPLSFSVPFSAFASVSLANQSKPEMHSKGGAFLPHPCVGPQIKMTQRRRCCHQCVMFIMDA